MTPAEPWLELHDVEKRYGSRHVLSVEKIAFHRGERVLIAGSNGSGKSTLLRILLGISRMDSGRRITPNPAPRIGFVPQSGGLYPDLSLRANIRVRRRLFGATAGEIEAGWCIDELGLAPLMDRPIVELSGGLQRLSAIVVALESKPTILAIDEPLNGVDEQRSEVLREALSKLAPQLDILLLASPIGAQGWSLTREVQMENGRIRDDRAV
jgi:ABC-type multidrug transport system ATPase subunit